MRRHVLKGRRTIEDYELLNSPPAHSPPHHTHSLLHLYNANYSALRTQKAQAADRARQNLPYSWLWEEYLQQDEVQRQLEAKARLNAINQQSGSEDAMMTPRKMRDEGEKHVLAKTVDSVEMLKKRTTLEKRRTHCVEREEEEDSHVVPSSVPVGRQFQRLARKVCFRLQDLKIEKIRGQLQECPSPQSLHLLPRSPSPCRRPSPSPPATTPHPRP